MGFFSDVWSGIKDVVSDVGSAVGNIWSGVGGVLADTGVPGVSQIGGVLEGAGNWLTGLDSQHDAHDQLRWEMAYNSNEAKLNRDWQSVEARLLRDHNVRLWQMNNDYNNPSAQIARAQAAGISPNAVIGSGMTGNSSSPASSSGLPTGSSASLGSSGLAPAILNNDLVRQNLSAQAEKTTAEAQGQNIQNDFDKQTFDDRVKQYKLANDKLKAEGINLLADAGLKNVRAEVEQGMYEWYSKKQPFELATMYQNLNNLRTEQFHIISKIKLNEEYAKTEREKQDLIEQQTITETHKQFELDSQSQLNYALARESDKKLYVLQEQGEYLDNLGELTEAQAKIADIEAKFSSVTGIPLGTPEFEANFYLWCKGDMEKFYTRVGGRAVQNFYEDKRQDIRDLKRGVISTVGNMLTFGRLGNIPFGSAKPTGFVNPSSSVGYPMN